MSHDESGYWWPDACLGCDGKLPRQKTTLCDDCAFAAWQDDQARTDKGAHRQGRGLPDMNELAFPCGCLASVIQLGPDVTIEFEWCHLCKDTHEKLALLGRCLCIVCASDTDSDDIADDWAKLVRLHKDRPEQRV